MFMFSPSEMGERVAESEKKIGGDSPGDLSQSVQGAAILHRKGTMPRKRRM